MSPATCRQASTRSATWPGFSIKPARETRICISAGLIVGVGFAGSAAIPWGLDPFATIRTLVGRLASGKPNRPIFCLNRIKPPSGPRVEHMHVLRWDHHLEHIALWRPAAELHHEVLGRVGPQAAVHQGF